MDSLAPADQMTLIVFGITAWVICAFIGAGIGKSKGRALDGFFLGLFLGPVGIIITALLSQSDQLIANQQAAKRSQHRQCPHCKEDMKRQAGTCPHCRLQSDAWQFYDGYWWANYQWLDEATQTWKPARNQHQQSQT